MRAGSRLELWHCRKELNDFQNPESQARGQHCPDHSGRRYRLAITVGFDSLLPLAGAVAIIGAAIYAKRYTGGIAARRATVDFRVKESANQALTEAKQVLGRASVGGVKALQALKRTENDEQWCQLSQTTMYLNHCELVAVAVKSGAPDETMDKMWNRSAYVQTWRRAQEYIEKERKATGQRTFLEHFEALAKSRDA